MLLLKAYAGDQIDGMILAVACGQIPFDRHLAAHMIGVGLICLLLDVQDSLVAAGLTVALMRIGTAKFPSGG